MSGDAKAMKQEAQASTSEKSKFDSARIVSKQKDRQEQTEIHGTSSSAPPTLEKVMQLAWEAAIKQNEQEKNQPRWRNILERILSNLDLNKFNNAQGDQELINVPNVQKLANDFIVSLSKNQETIEEGFNAIRDNIIQRKPIKKEDVKKIHGSIFAYTGASGSYYWAIPNRLPLEHQRHKNFVAKEMLSKQTAQFQHALQDFTETLDNCFPWKYWDSAGPTFGDKEQKIRNSDGSVFGVKEHLSHLSPDEIKKAIAEEKKFLLQIKELFDNPNPSTHQINIYIKKYIDQKQKDLVEKKQTLKKQMEALKIIFSDGHWGSAESSVSAFEKKEQKRIEALKDEVKNEQQALKDIDQVLNSTNPPEDEVKNNITNYIKYKEQTLKEKEQALTTTEILIKECSQYWKIDENHLSHRSPDEIKQDLARERKALASKKNALARERKALTNTQQVLGSAILPTELIDSIDQKQKTLSKKQIVLARIEQVFDSTNLSAKKKEYIDQKRKALAKKQEALITALNNIGKVSQYLEANEGERKEFEKALQEYIEEKDEKRPATTLRSRL